MYPAGFKLDGPTNDAVVSSIPELGPALRQRLAWRAEEMADDKSGIR
jgi:hypothetical protein